MEDYREHIQHRWDELKEKMISIYEEFLEAEEDEIYIHNYNWRVPRTTCRNHQVINRKPMFAYARSRL